MSQPHAKGRGAQVRPPNRFERIHLEPDLADVEHDEEYLESLRSAPTEYFVDDSRTIVSENDSPDVGFRYSVNPYRGCSHGCAYCYARPTHEYYGLSAGLDFETKVFVKLRAAELLRRWLARPRWQPEPIAFSGVTDCYQPAEAQFRLTRRCLEVALEARQPVIVVTKNARVTRDLDVLREMARWNAVRVVASVTTLDPELGRVMEPRTSTPAARLAAIGRLSAAGVPVSVLVAPTIPGLNDREMPAILRAAKKAGARSAGYALLRLPSSVRPVFLDWLERTQPHRAARILRLVRSTRAGGLSDSQFGRRLRGEGPVAEQIRQLFHVFAARYGLDDRQPPLETAHFRPPRTAGGQLRLF